MKVLRLSSEDFPDYWNALPSLPELREIGAKWLRAGNTAVLAVPSVIVPFAWNYLLNPAHPDFSNIQIGEPREYRFDPRLSQR